MVKKGKMRKLFVLLCILIAIATPSSAYYTVEQIKYEQSLGKTDTLNRAMENPRQFEKMYNDYYAKRYQENDYKQPTQTQEKPLYKFGNTLKF